MLDISSILNFITTEVVKNPERFEIIDDEHLLDHKTGIKFHLYDDYFKITHDNFVIATKGDFTEGEQQIIWKIKQAITDPEVSAERDKTFQDNLKARRLALANYFETPKPPLNNTPSPEVGTIAYTG